MTILRKKLNITLLFLLIFLFGLYIYQTISISSGIVSLVNLKKEFLERKNDLSSAVYDSGSGDDFELSFIKENLKMAEIEKFDYIIIGPSEFALIPNEAARARPERTSSYGTRSAPLLRTGLIEGNESISQ